MLTSLFFFLFTSLLSDAGSYSKDDQNLLSFRFLG